MSSLVTKLAKTTPLVVVLGSTGAGKSKLALELCMKFNGEIISTDSMQLYKGLDIVTNKVTSEERRLVPHHLIDFVSPMKTDYDVTTFRNTALPLIDKLLEENKLPVIVGGTNYYIEALLWRMLIDTSHEKKDEEPLKKKQRVGVCASETSDTVPAPDASNSIHNNSPEATSADPPQPIHNPPHATFADRFDFRKRFEHVSTSELYNSLIAKDPLAQQRYHPNERRKLLRALEVIERTGKPVTELYKEQHDQGRVGVSGPLRYPHVCVIWVQSEQTVLDERTDRRVEQMVEQGLVAELQAFHRQYNQQRLQENTEADYTRGIFQSIGFKEFHEYLVLPDNEKETEASRQLLAKGIEDMKRMTRKYARKQSKWVISRFIKRKGESVPPVYVVDSTQVDMWDTNVYQPAQKILQAFLEGRRPEQAAVPCEERSNGPCYHVCHVCEGKVFVWTRTWREHMQGNKHKRRVAKLKRDTERNQAVAQETGLQSTVTESNQAVAQETGLQSTVAESNQAVAQETGLQSTVAESNQAVAQETGLQSTVAESNQAVAQETGLQSTVAESNQAVAQETGLQSTVAESNQAVAQETGLQSTVAESNQAVAQETGLQSTVTESNQAVEQETGLQSTATEHHHAAVQETSFQFTESKSHKLSVAESKSQKYHVLSVDNPESATTLNGSLTEEGDSCNDPKGVGSSSKVSDVLCATRDTGAKNMNEAQE